MLELENYYSKPNKTIKVNATTTHAQNSYNKKKIIKKKTVN